MRDLLVKKIQDKIAKASFTDEKKHNEDILVIDGDVARLWRYFFGSGAMEKLL